ncbi:uncharacterized protein BT62DRAFT_928740 [Guyanagaster necrorhizus]|uniref:Uncharacterized protein n=1 Tax=Guyanagaster necrorhizus TaxID=856835 RepID=A0A9P7W0H2_9AGAR|nr:uncharacterized protein BT62DRAFT_928740 [Guyanagaster necrorhizus MCA 3950]KAG7449963.1 hypothetical protein BT62DRAFT_928740 [Guyanagaster necrorhizus MCA 3950]
MDSILSGPIKDGDKSYDVDHKGKGCEDDGRKYCSYCSQNSKDKDDDDHKDDKDDKKDDKNGILRPWQH